MEIQRPKKKIFAVNAGQLIKAIKTLDSQSLEFEVLEYQIIVRHSIGQFALPLVYGVEEYNAYPRPTLDHGRAQYIELEAPGLRAILNRLNFAIAQDELRPAMNGVIINLTKEHTDFVASDGHVLARIRKPSIKTERPAAMIIPRRAIGILQKILPTTGFVEIYFNEYDVNWPADSEVKQPAPVYHIIVDGITITGKPIEGRYPNYNSVIPTTFYKEFTANRTTLIKSFERLSQFTSTSGLITLELRYGKLTMTAADKDFELSAKETLPITYTGELFKIGFKDHYLLQLLKNIASTDVVFNIVDQSRAVIVSPSIQPENEEITMLMMPMLVND